MIEKRTMSIRYAHAAALDLTFYLNIKEEHENEFTGGENGEKHGETYNRGFRRGS